jgi:hypothetical protein
MPGVPLAIGTVLPKGADTPPTTASKALYIGIYNALIAIIAGISQTFPDLDANWKMGIALAGLVLSALGSPIIAYLKTNQLEQAVQVIDPPGQHAAPEV